MKKEVKWVIDDYLIEEPYNESLDTILEELGYEYSLEKYIPFKAVSDAHPFYNPDNSPAPVILYGSTGFIKQYMHPSYMPGMYYDHTRFLCSEYMTRYPISWFANHDYIMMPYKHFADRTEYVYDILNTNKIFIRPDSGSKTFTGTALHIDELHYELNSLTALSSVVDNTKVLISKCKNIESEYRYFIVDGEVVAHTQYKQKGYLKPKLCDNEECRELANKVASYDYQLDIAYVCDIGIVDGEAKIIEFNSISSSGFYAAEIRNIVSALSEAAWKEFNGDLTIID